MLYDCLMVNDEHVWDFDLTLRVFIHKLELHYHSILNMEGEAEVCRTSRLPAGREVFSR